MTTGEALELSAMSKVSRTLLRSEIGAPGPQWDVNRFKRRLIISDSPGRSRSCTWR